MRRCLYLQECVIPVGVAGWWLVQQQVLSSGVGGRVMAVAAWLMAVAESVRFLGTAGFLLLLAQATSTGSRWRG